jgi:hypothetical protein
VEGVTYEKRNSRIIVVEMRDDPMSVYFLDFS